MVMGWDHQSHFTVFASVYENGGVWDPAPPLDESFLSSYPALASVLGVALTLLVKPEVIDPEALVTYYVHTTALLSAVSFALLSWVGYRACLGLRGLPSKRRARVAAASAVILAGVMILGPMSAFYDMGFTNFVLAASIASTASWVSAEVGARRPWTATFVIAASVASVAQLWTPLVLLMFPAVTLHAWRVVRGRRWAVLAGAVLLACASCAVVAWQVLKLAPDGAQATTLAGTVAAVGGGLPAVPVLQAIALLVATIVAAAVRIGRRRRPWTSLALPAAGGLLLTAIFVVNTLRADAKLLNAYYVAKASWAVYIVALPIVVPLVFVVLTSAATAMAGGSGARRRWTVDTRAGLVTVGCAALIWSTLAYLNTPGGKTGYFSVPPGVQGWLSKWEAYRGVHAGDLILSAEDITDDRPRRVAILWDAGDLLHNRWLATLRGQLTVRNNNVLSALPGAPYVEPAREALVHALESDPSLRVVITWFEPETRKLLRPIKKEFPGRVALRRM